MNVSPPDRSPRSARRRRWAQIAVALVVMCAAFPSHAEETAQDDARRAFAAGRALYEAGRYREAIAEFETGYRLAPRPEFLLNIGQAHRQLFEPEKAKEKYEAFLAAARPDAPGRQEVIELLAQINRALAEQRDLAPAATGLAPAAKTSSVATTSTPAPKRSFARRHWWIFPTAAVVLTGIGLGIYFGVRSDQGAGCPGGALACLEASR